MSIQTLFYSIILILYSISSMIAQDNIYNNKIDVISYEFNIEISDTEDVITAISNNEFILLEKTDIIHFDLVSIDSINKGMKVSKILIGDTNLTFEHVNNVLRINTLTEWIVNDTLSINIFYSGIPKDGLIISKNKFGDRTFFGDNWPNRAHNYLPVVDHPSDKAYASFIITSPLQYEIVSNGMLMERSYIDNNKRLTHWASKTTIPTKVMVFAAAKFSTSYLGKVDCTPVTAWVFPQNRKEGFHDYTPSIEVLQYFNDMIGEYPYPKLANVQSKTRYGGMENASCIFYYENSVTGENKVTDLIAHEIAHQWFGNSVSESDWPHIWLSEGFATYLADLYMKYKYGDEVYQNRLQKEKLKALSFIKSYPMPIIARDITDLNQLLNPNSYQRAAWVLHMYHNKVGDDVFWNTLSAYYHEYKDHNATTIDFVNIANRISGNDYSNFFDQWLDRGDYPILEISTIKDGKNTKIQISQTQDGTFYELDIPLEVNRSGKNEVVNIQMNKKSITYVLKNNDKNVNYSFEGLNDVFCEWEVK